MSDNKNKELNNASLSSSASNGRGGLAIYWNAFKTFFQIGAFTLGGGYAMISLIENEVVERKKWISKEEFVDLIAMAQSCLVCLL